MDRRAALAKMGLGTGAAIGASAVISSPVFAGAGSSGETDPAPIVTVLGPGAPGGPTSVNQIIVNVVAGTWSCPGAGDVASVQDISASPTRVLCQPAGAVGMWLDVTQLGFARVIPPDAGPLPPTVWTVSSTTGSLTFELTKAPIPFPFGPGLFVWDDGDEFAVEVATTFGCTSPEGVLTPSAPIVVTVNRRYNGTTGVWAAPG